MKNYCLTKLQKLRNATKLIFSFLILLFTLIFLQTNAYAVTRAVTGKALVMSTGNSYLDFTSYGSNVTVDNTTGDFTGYAFLEDVGWVDFGTVDNPDGPVNLDFDTEAVTMTHLHEKNALTIFVNEFNLGDVHWTAILNRESELHI